MPIEISRINDGKILDIKLSGKLQKADYPHFVPKIDEAIRQHGKVRLLVEMRDFHGWELGAVWEDIKFDLKHFSHIERIAMLGDKKWEQWMASFCKPFTTAKIKYFPLAQEADAEAWVTSS